MIYDVAVIGSGVSGASIAKTLSRYNLNVIILEKECDVAFSTSKANSGIVHGAFHHNPKYLKSKLEIEGNLMFDKLHKELDFPFIRNGILVVALTEEELKQCEYLYNNGIANGSIGIELCSRERILELEPKLTHDVIGGLYAPLGGIVEPYRFVFALIESAKNNGVTLKTDFNVDKAVFNDGDWQIISTKKEVVTAKYVVNSAGLYADKVSLIFNAEQFIITPRKGQYYLLDRLTKAFTNKVIFPVPSKVTKGILVIPTCEGTVLVGPTAVETLNKEDLATSSDELSRIFDFVRKMVPSVSERDVITSFAGLRPAMESDDFYIDISKEAKNFIQVAGIQSPGLTSAPAIGEYVKNLLKKAGLTLTEKVDYEPTITKTPRLRHLSIEETDELVQKDKNYGNIVCRCETVSEAEIIEAIKHGHTTLDGVKFFTRAQMGRCQGGFCTYKIVKIIMEHTGLTFDEITKRGEGSYIFDNRL